MSPHPPFLENCRVCSSSLVGAQKVVPVLKEAPATPSLFISVCLVLLLLLYNTVINRMSNIMIYFSVHCPFLPLITEAHEGPAHLLWFRRYSINAYWMKAGWTLCKHPPHLHLLQMAGCLQLNFPFPLQQKSWIQGLRTLLTGLRSFKNVSSGTLDGWLSSERRAWSLKLLFLHLYNLGMSVKSFEMQQFEGEQSWVLCLPNVWLSLLWPSKTESQWRGERGPCPLGDQTEGIRFM